jgi:hypothetical protein
MKRFHSVDHLFTLPIDFHIGATHNDAGSLNLAIKRQVLLKGQRMLRGNVERKTSQRDLSEKEMLRDFKGNS